MSVSLIADCFDELCAICGFEKRSARNECVDAKFGAAACGV
jgi:hypothetical protein